MANDFQRGYLSGVLQRGARPATAVALPGAATRFQAPSLPVETLNPLAAEPAGEIESFESSTTSAQPRLPNVMAESAAQQTNLSQPRLTPPTTIVEVPAFVPASRLEVPEGRRPSEKKAEPASPHTNVEKDANARTSEEWIWGTRLPRLVKLDENERTATRPDLGSTRATTNPLFTNQSDPVERLRENSLHESSSTDARDTDDGSANTLVASPSRRNESAAAMSFEVTTQPSSSNTQAAWEDPREPHNDNSDREPGAESRVTVSPIIKKQEASEPVREIVVEHVHTMPQERSLTVRPVTGPTEADGRMASGRTNVSPHLESPRLTIHRIDVQIVAQASTPVVQVVQQPPPPQPDGWESLERYHLDYLGLIF